VKNTSRKTCGEATCSTEGWTAGMDLGDRWGHYCIENAQGQIVESGKVKMTREALSMHFPGSRPLRIALETGTHSNWVRSHLESLGHEVIVANARELHALTGSNRKSDPEDARKLAMYARVDPRILRPIQHRSLEAQHDLAVIKARDALVRVRTVLINAARGLAKSCGHRLPNCTSAQFSRECQRALPVTLKASVGTLLAQIDQLTQQIQNMDRTIQQLGEKSYPQTARLSQVHGVGTLTALTYVLTLEDPARFKKSRDVGSFLGLRPRQSQSGGRDPQLGISKAGNRHLRWLLVECAHRVMSTRAPDSNLKRWGLRLCERGGKNAKRRAIVAVARKLSVLLHKLWITGETYHPLYGCRCEAAMSAHIA
jgi:transposase